MSGQVRTSRGSRPLRGLFVSGTGTDVGKTVALAALLRACGRAGVRVRPIKIVQTGVSCPGDVRGDALPVPDAEDLPPPLRTCAMPSHRRPFAASPCQPLPIWPPDGKARI